MMNRPSPYVGPRAFKPGEMLYGRDREALDLVRLVVPERIVLLYSPSGAGKTSLLTAKLISHDELKEHKFQILGPARVFGPAGLGSPSDSFNPYVSSLIHDWEEGCKDEKLTDLGGIDLSGYLAQRSWIREDPNPKMLILDQFEEILTHNPLDKEKKLEFFRQLGTALRDRNRWAIIAMKEEYIAGLDPYLHLLPTRLAARYRLELLSHEQAEQAIKEPAKSAGVVYRPEALKRLVGELSTVHEPGVDVYHTPYIEPLHLQVVCDGLWQKLPDGATEVGPKLIETAGNVNEALGGYYGDAVHAIAQTVQGEDAGAVERRIRDWFESELISPTGLRDQLQRGAQTTGSLPNNLIDALGGRYLLRMEMRRGTQWYEIAHDRLVEVIRSNNQAWYERQEKALQILENQASKWLKHHAAGRSAEADAELLAGDTRVLVEEWARDHPGILKDSDRRFLAASAAREMKQKNLRSMKWVVVAVTLLLLLTLVYIIVTQKRNYRILALLNDKNAELSSSLTKVNMEQKQTISLLEKSRNEMRAHKLLADSAQARWRLNDHELAALLALQSERYAAKLNNREFSARILDNLRSILQLRPFILSPKLDGLPEKARKGGLLDFSPDGSFIAAQSNESEFEVLPLFERGNNPEPVRLKTRGILRGLEFSSSGKYLVAITKSGMELFPAKQLASADRAGGGIRSIPVQTSGEPDGFFCTSASDTILFVALAKGDIEGFRQADGGGFDRKFLANPRTGDGELKAMVCGPDGKWIALGDSNGEITILPGIDGRIKPSRIRNEFDRWPPRMTEQWTFLKNYLDYGVSSLFFWPERNQLVAVFRQGPMGLVSMPDNAGAEPAMVYVLETQESLAELKVMADRGLARREVARKSKITAADFIPAEGRLVVGSEKSVGEWDLSKFLVEPESRWNANYRDVMILQEPIRKLKFKRDGKAVFTIDQGLNVRVVLRDGLEKVGYSVRPTWKEGDRPCLISSLRLLPGSNKLVAGGSGFLAFMEMDRDLNLKRTDEWPCFDGSFRAMSLDRDARRLALAVQTDKVHAGGCRASQSKDKNAVWLFQDPDGTGDWKMSTPAPMSVKQSKGLWSVSWSKGPWTQGRELLAASDYMGAVWIWPFGGGSARPLANSPQRLPRAESGWIRAAAFHPTEPLIALGAEDGGLEIWRLNLDAEGRVSANQLKARGWKKRGPVRALAWSPDGAILVYGGDNGKMGGIPAGPMKTGDSWEESSEFSAHTMGVTALVFCDDSAFDASENPLGCDRNTFASAGNDGKIRMWRIRETEGVAPRIDSSPKLTLEGPDSEVQSIDLSRDGRTVVAGDAKGQVHLWRIESGQLLDSACGAMRRNLSTDEWRRYVGDDIPREETCPDLPAAAHDASGSIAVRHRN